MRSHTCREKKKALWMKRKVEMKSLEIHVIEFRFYSGIPKGT